MADEAAPAGATWHYPAIVACLGDGRKADRREIHKVARRIWREYRGRETASRAGRFAALRRILVLARITLHGAPAR